MSDYIQENRRAVIMFVVALCIAMLGGLYLLLSGGSAEEELSPVTRGQPLQPAQPVERRTHVLIITQTRPERKNVGHACSVTASISTPRRQDERRKEKAKHGQDLPDSVGWTG